MGGSLQQSNGGGGGKEGQILPPEKQDVGWKAERGENTGFFGGGGGGRKICPLQTPHRILQTPMDPYGIPTDPS